ncbi:HNH endonuclease signature motif containing protein [Pseudomonas aeruginosa]|uniref:HNH endonuclease signature motif containing protein n=1 Tax=Pseudomonas aeruginosa TaxID=287 RepID=UPI000997E1CC
MGKRQYAHRLAWLYMTGEWPSDQVDHVNCEKNDNRWSNLRIAGKSRNMQNIGLRSNNSSGFTGVGYHRQTGRWRAFIVDDGKMVHVGLFDTIDEAATARERAAKRQYGEFYHPS